ncbi:MAG: hypothetical protein IJ083_13175 [Clostridia bacterium]|nr:hypothetical protein [Clostridia bacterium]
MEDISSVLEELQSIVDQPNATSAYGQTGDGSHTEPVREHHASDAGHHGDPASILPDIMNPGNKPKISVRVMAMPSFGLSGFLSHLISPDMIRQFMDQFSDSLRENGGDIPKFLNLTVEDVFGGKPEESGDENDSVASDDLDESGDAEPKPDLSDAISKLFSFDDICKLLDFAQKNAAAAEESESQDTDDAPSDTGKDDAQADTDKDDSGEELPF